MDHIHTANVAYSTACSLRQLAKVLPYADKDRKAQLIQHAKTMVAPFAYTLQVDGDLEDAISMLMAYVPASIPAPV